MLWFKHIANTTSDPDLMTGILRFGSDAYYVFFETLEILTKEEVFDEPKVFDFAFFKTFFPHISGPKLKSILTYFSDCRGNAGEMPRILAEFNGLKVILFCDKLSKLSRSYVKKLGKKTEKNSTHRRKKKEERRKKEDITPTSSAPGFPEASPKQEKKKYGESVLMSEDEYSALVKRLGDKTKADRAVEILDNYKVSKGKKYKNDYRAILSWVVDRLEEEIASGKFRPATAAPINPIVAERLKIDAMVDRMLSMTYLSEAEAFAKYNEDTRQNLCRAKLSDLSAKYFCEYIVQYFRKPKE